jgi:hypothetical protein
MQFNQKESFDFLNYLSLKIETKMPKDDINHNLHYFQLKWSSILLSLNYLI